MNKIGRVANVVFALYDGYEEYQTSGKIDRTVATAFSSLITAVFSGMVGNITTSILAGSSLAGPIVLILGIGASMLVAYLMTKYITPSFVESVDSMF